MSVEYNEDELLTPAWLNIAFFQQVIKTMLKCEFTPQICDLLIKPASRKGDHYASVMFRVTFKYKVVAAEHSLVEKIVIVKTVPPLDTAKGHNLLDSHFFANEVHIYNEIVPHFEALWRQYGENIQFSGRALYTSLQPQPVLVLEDLCLSGYDILRERLFNRDEVRRCLAKLAKWHAVSHKVAAERDITTPVAATALTALERLQHGLFTATNLMNSPYMHNGLQSMIAALEQAGGFENYLPQLRAMQPQLLQRCRRMNDAYGAGVAGPIYVLNHGDFHTRNLMVQRDVAAAEGTLKEFLFIDFQASFLGPSCCDLQYLCFTMLDRKLRDEHRETLERYYVKCFQNDLKKLQFRGRLPTYEDFKADCKRWRHFEIYLLATNLPLSAINPDKPSDIDINQIFDNAAYRQKFYTNPDYIAYLRELLPKYLAEGYLDE